MTPTEKPEIVKMFLRGTDIADVARFFGCSKGTVERVLREAIIGLSELNTRIVEESKRREHDSTSTNGSRSGALCDLGDQATTSEVEGIVSADDAR